MIKRAAIALEIAFGLIWILLFTKCLDLLDQPSSLDVGLGAAMLLGSVIVFPTVMRNVWRQASAHFRAEKESNNAEGNTDVSGADHSVGPDGLRSDQN